MNRPHLTPPTIDSDVIVQLLTPQGYVVHLADIAPTVQEKIAKGEDTRAAITMARLTGLDCTIRRTTQTTVKASDCE